MTDHAVLAPSSAVQWGNCSGSVMAQMGRPDPETDESRAGTAAHWVMAEVLLNFKHDGRGPLLCSDYIGKQAPNGVVVDRDMAEGADVIVQDVLSVCQKHGGLQYLLIEQRVHMPEIHPDNWGTLDVALPLLHKNLVYVWDYKHGHRSQTAEGNFQLIDYAEGLRAMFQIDGHAAQQIDLVMRIVHPYYYGGREGPISAWFGKLADIRPYVNQLRAKAAEALTAPRLSSGTWCRDCKALANCPAARQAVRNLIYVSDQPYDMEIMTPHDMAVEWRLLKEGSTIVKARIEALEDQLKHMIGEGKAGDSGLTMESSAGRLKYTVPPAQAIAIAAQFGVDIKVEECLTPTQSISKAPAAIREAFASVVNTVAQRSAGALKLTPAADSIASRAFKRR